MLTCVYHPIDDFIVVEDDEADKLLASGVWFDSPLKAQDYRNKVENELKEENKAIKTNAKPKRKD